MVCLVGRWIAARRTVRFATVERDRPSRPAAPQSARTPPAARAVSRQQVIGNRQLQALARYTKGDTKQRTDEMWEERGRKGIITAADTKEANAQLAATDRVVEKRAAEKFQAKGIAKQDDFDDLIDRVFAAAEIRKEFKCDRLGEWDTLLKSTKLWGTAGMDAMAAKSLKIIKANVAGLRGLLTGHNLKAQRKMIDTIEQGIDFFVSTHGKKNADRADLLLLLKRYTMGHERKKLVLAERIANTYGIKLDSMELVKANKKSYGSKSLKQYVEMMEPEVFSLEELEGIESVLKRYAPMLGKKRDKKLGAQPLTIFGRAHYGIDYDDARSPERDPDTRGESFAKSKTVGMYDAGTKASQFPTGMQQFRGTFAHELSHALIEDVKNSKGEKTILAYAKATGVWKDRFTTDYERDSNQATWDAMKADGKEPPITTYGASNAQEDMADAIKFLFEDPAKLKKECPIRYRWIIENLSGFFEEKWFKSLPPKS
jgi:hypothetical protein